MYYVRTYVFVCVQSERLTFSSHFGKYLILILFQAHFSLCLFVGLCSMVLFFFCFCYCFCFVEFVCYLPLIRYVILYPLIESLFFLIYYFSISVFLFFFLSILCVNSCILSNKQLLFGKQVVYC